MRCRSPASNQADQAHRRAGDGLSARRRAPKLKRVVRGMHVCTERFCASTQHVSMDTTEVFLFPHPACGAWPRLSAWNSAGVSHVHTSAKQKKGSFLS